MDFAELRSITYRDLAHPSLNNDKLVNDGGDSIVDQALNLALKVFVNRVAYLPACAVYRDLTIAAVTTQATYDIPPDCFDVRDVAWHAWTSILIKSSHNAETFLNRSYRTAAAGTAVRWLWDGKKIRLSPAPSFDGSKNVLLEGIVEPYAAGGGIASLVRATNECTLSTTYAHGFAVGDHIQVHGVTETSFDGDDFTITAVPTSATLTYAQTDDDETATAGVGIVGYTDGILPMYLERDVPPILPKFHMGLVDHAVSTLAAGYLQDEQESTIRAQAGAAGFEEKVALFLMEHA